MFTTTTTITTDTINNIFTITTVITFTTDTINNTINYYFRSAAEKWRSWVSYLTPTIHGPKPKSYKKMASMPPNPVNSFTQEESSRL